MKEKKRKGKQTESKGAKRGKTAGGNGRQDARRVRYVRGRSGKGSVPLTQTPDGGGG